MSSEPTVKCGAGLSVATDTDAAVEEAYRLAQESAGVEPDLVLVFFSPIHDADRISALLSEKIGQATLLGCCGESIVGGSREVEQEPALSLWMGRLPGVHRDVLHLDYSSDIDEGSFLGWTDEFLEPWPEGTVMLLFGEPFSFPADRFAALVNEEHPGVLIAGGMASGGSQPGSHRLILGREIHDKGAVLVRLHGALHSRTLVSQGCRPIGQPMVITRADRNIVFELGGKPALAQLQELFETLSTQDRAKVQQGVHLGRVIDEYKEGFETGDFLVRNVIGADQQSGAIAVGDFVRAGQTVQFHIRDAQTADEDLKSLLSEAADVRPTAGALLFTCNGRGTRLFETADHDAKAFNDAFNGAALAGFFAAGEIGAVAGRNFLHGFTASLLLFDED